MKTYTIYTAKTHLSQLIEQACAGEEVVIAKGKNPVASDFIAAQAAVWCNAGQGYGHRSFFRTIAERRISSLGAIIESFAGYPHFALVAERRRTLTIDSSQLDRNDRAPYFGQCGIRLGNCQVPEPLLRASVNA